MQLELVREEKLYRLLPGGKPSSRLEASGVGARERHHRIGRVRQPQSDRTHRSLAETQTDEPAVARAKLGTWLRGHRDRAARRAVVVLDRGARGLQRDVARIRLRVRGRRQLHPLHAAAARARRREQGIRGPRSRTTRRPRAACTRFTKATMAERATEADESTCLPARATAAGSHRRDPPAERKPSSKTTPRWHIATAGLQSSRKRRRASGWRASTTRRST